MIGMVAAEPVEMVSLALEFPAPEICQVIDVINIVKALTIGADQEHSREMMFQFSPVGVGDAGDAAGNTPFFRVPENGFNGGFLVTGTHGIGVNAFSVEMRKNHSAAMQKGDFLMSPQEQITK
jgi:hypothetical protein